MPGPITFGRYVLLDKLALGGMAEIFLAKAVGEAGFEKALVIKRVLPHLTQAPGFVEMFLDEARIAAQLSHPGIVQIFDLGKEDDDYYFAMEYLAGEDLSAILRKSDEVKRPIPVDVAVKIAASAAEALHYAHEFRTPDGKPMGIVHRDISPSNLLVTYHGAVKVLDFGIARAEQRLQHTRAGHVKGKAAYMSPEQARGATVDRRTDVWALGVCLHEMLTGRRLFLRDSSAETLNTVREWVIPHPRSFRPEIPPDLDALVMRALERDLSKRLQSADELRAGLDRFLADRTYVPQSVQLGTFLRGLFGEARADQQLRRALLSANRKTEGTESLPPPPVHAQELVTEVGQLSREETVNVRTPTPPELVDPPNTVLTDLPHVTESVVTATVRERRPVVMAASVAVAVAAIVFAAGWVVLSREKTAPPVPVPIIVAATPRAPEPIASPATHKEDAKPTIAAPAPSEKPPPMEKAPAPVKISARPPPPKPITGRLSLSSNVPATAWVDGRRAGELPLNVSIPAGAHRLKIENPSLGISRTARVTIEPGKETSQELTFSKGKLNVMVDPWADVYVNGAKLGQTPLAGRELYEGRHQVRLVGPGGEKTVAVDIVAGRTAVLRETLP